MMAVCSDTYMAMKRDLRNKIEELKQERDQWKSQAETEALISSSRRDEIDQLRARVAELEEHMRCAAYQDDESYDEAQELLIRQPSQSLAAHDARVLREFGSKMGREGWNDFPSGNIGSAIKRCADYEADRIEAEGKDENQAKV